MHNISEPRPTDSENSSASESSAEKSRKSKKRDKKDKKPRKRKHKHASEEKELLKQAKRFLKRKLQEAPEQHKPAVPPTGGAMLLSGQRGLPPEQSITLDDYFSKNTEFTSYLLESKGLYFNELSSDEARHLFQDFVNVWNSGRLPPRYYAGQVSAPVKRTNFKWQFKGGADSAGQGSTGMAAFMQDEKEQEVEARQLGREWERGARRKWNQEQQQQLDELLPKATGREALVEKKLARKEDAKAREDSPDRAFLPGGGDIMGGGDSFAAAKAREVKRQEWRQKQTLAKNEELVRRRADFEAQEAAKMAQFRALVAKGPISIRKRQDAP